MGERCDLCVLIYFKLFSGTVYNYLILVGHELLFNPQLFSFECHSSAPENGDHYDRTSHKKPPAESTILSLPQKSSAVVPGEGRINQWLFNIFHTAAHPPYRFLVLAFDFRRRLEDVLPPHRIATISQTYLTMTFL